MALLGEGGAGAVLLIGVWEFVFGLLGLRLVENLLLRVDMASELLTRDARPHLQFVAARSKQT